MYQTERIQCIKSSISNALNVAGLVASVIGAGRVRVRIQQIQLVGLDKPVSRLVHGSTGLMGAEEEVASAVLDAPSSTGINVFDTAAVYAYDDCSMVSARRRMEALSPKPASESPPDLGVLRLFGLGAGCLMRLRLTLDNARRRCPDLV